MSVRTVQRTRSEGTWEALFPHVYRLPATPRTGRQRAMAASLRGGPESAISHTTAGRLLRLDGLEAELLHLTVPRTAWLRSDRARLHGVSHLPLIDRSRVDGIPCTTATRTADRLRGIVGDEALEVAFESARRMGLTSPRALAQRAEALCGSGKPGSRAIRALLAHQRAGEPALQYRLEVKMARLLRSSRLPPPTRQLALGRYRIDFAFAPTHVGVECEGFEFHGHRLQWKTRQTAHRLDRSAGLAPALRHLGRRHEAAARDHRPDPSRAWRARATRGR